MLLAVLAAVLAMTTLFAEAFAQVPAQVPALGRWQDFAYTNVSVLAAAAEKYQQLVGELHARGQLDDEPEVFSIVSRAASRLVRCGIRLQPTASTWDWEVHTTSSIDYEAVSMAGGKLLFSSAYIRRMQLNDEEVAILVGHEVAHALAQHQRELLSQNYYRNVGTLPLSLDTAMERLDTSLELRVSLSALTKIQESEADQLGMLLAHDAGWGTSAMISFYEQLNNSDSPTFLSWSYPSSSSRLGMARELAALFDHPGPKNRCDPRTSCGYHRTRCSRPCTAGCGRDPGRLHAFEIEQGHVTTSIGQVSARRRKRLSNAKA